MNDRVRPTPERIAALKAEARAMRASGTKQSAALAQLAQREGFRNWEELIGIAAPSRAQRDELRSAVADIRRTPEQVANATRRHERAARFTHRNP